MVVAGALENVDFVRFRGGQLRKVLNDSVHPKWQKDNSPTVYYDVGLLILDKVSLLSSTEVTS